MAYIFSALFVLATSAIILLYFEKRGLISFLLGIYLLSCANIIFCGLILGLFDYLSNQIGYLFFQALFFSLALLIVYKNKSRFNFRTRLYELFEVARSSLREIFASRVLVILIIVIVFSALFMLILIWFLPPNSHDSMVNHMARVGYWLQNGTYKPYPTHNIQGAIYPYNPSLLYAWSVTMLGSDRLVEISQFLAGLAGALAVMGISRELGDSRRSAAFKGLLFLSFPVIVMQSTTTQTDLLMGSFCASGVYFLLRGIRSSDKSALACSALSIGLALGSKQLVFAFLPGIALIAFVATFITKKLNMQGLILWISASAIAVLVFGVASYVFNFITYANPFGPKDYVTDSLSIDKTDNPIKMIAVVSSRFAYSAIDPVGLSDKAKIYLIKAKSQVAEPVFNAFGLDLEADEYLLTEHTFNYSYTPHTTEDEAWFGILGFLLLFAAFIPGVYCALKQRHAAKLALMSSALIYFFGVVAGRPGFDIYQGRYFITLVLLALPLVPLPDVKSVFGKLLKLGMVYLSVFILINTHVNNEAKPLTGKETVWHSSWAENITRQYKQYRPILNDVYIQIPPNANVGLIFNPLTWDYPLFTERFSRTLTPIVPAVLAQDEAWLREQGIQYILVNTPEDPWEKLPTHLNYFFQTENFRYIKVRPPK